jgi:hypothetical protein
VYFSCCEIGLKNWWLSESGGWVNGGDNSEREKVSVK